ncbi:hypothetical protein [Streptomyces sp. NPDC017435]|uniref:hypothetical protein n=1 Tax=Streptomyces sp. NPDC017435 TaxID=3364995 RepID=UPI0037B8F8EF
MPALSPGRLSSGAVPAPSRNSPTGRLPLGRQQLVEPAKALAGAPRLLILDEATSALDEDQVAAVFRVIRELRDQGGSVILVTHRMAELFAVGDRLTVLRDGAVMATREREGSRLVFLDLTGAVKGYADGLPTGALAADEAWRIGVDPAAVGAVVPGYAVLAYARYAERVAADTAACRAVLPASCSLRAVLRPGVPDTASAEHLAARTAAATGPGRADAVDFYHYGLVPFPVPDRIPVALKER